MDISELKGTVLQRFEELTEEEAGILQTMEQHPVGEVVMKLIGPELTEIFSGPTEESMDETAVAIPTEMNTPMEEPVEPVA